MKLQETIRPRYGRRELKKGNKLTMKQAKKKIISAALVCSLLLAMYECTTDDSSIADNTQRESNDYSAYAGITQEVNQMLQDSKDATINETETSTVGTPLEDAIMNDEGEVVDANFEPYTMYITPSFLNVRSTPSKEEDNVIGKLNINDEVTVIGEVGDEWVKIEYSDGEAYISSEYTQETLPELDTYNNDWNGPKLNKHNGTCQGPSGKETYYNLNMSRVIYYMQQLGYYEKYWVRSDGIKCYGPYIMAAADLRIYPKGTIVMSSLGPCLICDTGDFATNGSGTVLDIATTW